RPTRRTDRVPGDRVLACRLARPPGPGLGPAGVRGREDGGDSLVTAVRLDGRRWHSVESGVLKFLTSRRPMITPPRRAEVAPPSGAYRLRTGLTDEFLAGSGIEIGALHHPLAVPAGVRVTYLDRLNVSGLRREYPELAAFPLMPVDVIDDGETLRTILD